MRSKVGYKKALRSITDRMPWLAPENAERVLCNVRDVVDVAGKSARFSAGFVVDLGNGTQQGTSIVATPLLSGSIVAVGSGVTVGQGIYMGNADAYCNLQVTGVSASGRLRVAVQCAPADVSGQYTDPTSGLAQLPGAFSSGGILWLNSGQDNGLLGAVVSGQNIASGFAVAQGFVRNGLYVRALALNEGTAQFAGPLTVNFVSQLRTTGSGGGYSLSPSSGTVSV